MGWVRIHNRGYTCTADGRYVSIPGAYDDNIVAYAGPCGEPATPEPDGDSGGGDDYVPPGTEPQPGDPDYPVPEPHGGTQSEWQQIHAGGWVCHWNGEYRTGTSPPSDPCFDPTNPNAWQARGVTEDGRTIMLNIVTGEVYYVNADGSVGESGPGTAPNPFGSRSGGGGGGGRGGVGSRGQYIPPDRRVVEEAVKGKLIALTGRFDQARVDLLTDKFMSESKRAYDNRESQQIDPMASVVEQIRTFQDYKQIHQLRPEEADEETWISSRQGALTSLGISEARAVGMGVDAAQAGFNQEQTAQSGQIQEFQRTGQAKFGLEDSIRAAARNALRLL